MQRMEVPAGITIHSIQSEVTSAAFANCALVEDVFKATGCPPFLPFF